MCIRDRPCSESTACAREWVTDAGATVEAGAAVAARAAIRALIEDAVPMFEFAVRTTIARFDLANAEGRVRALEAVAPIVAGIRDRSLRPEYTRTVAGWLGVEVEQVASEVGRATRMAARAATAAPTATSSVTDSRAHAVDSEHGRDQG